MTSASALVVFFSQLLQLARTNIPRQPAIVLKYGSLLDFHHSSAIHCCTSTGVCGGVGGGLPLFDITWNCTGPLPSAASAMDAAPVETVGVEEDKVQSTIVAQLRQQTCGPAL
jgi:hypothetical protein